VNIVAGDLFSRFCSLEDFANADIEELEAAVFSCGLYKTKAKNIKDMCRVIIDRFNSEVPDNLEDLLRLPGVGRKTANLILGDIFGKPAIVADTHCIRISNRLGLCSVRDPYKVEMRLRELIPPGESADFCHRLVFFGRGFCKARRPLCGECFLRDLCDNYEL
jgi:endonuclease-3